MRLFIAILFSDETRDKLFRCRQRLAAAALEGNFTRRENLHLTLAFIGETERRQQLCRVLDSLRAETFSIYMEGLGAFQREGGDICWMGLRRNRPLEELHGQLAAALEQADFSLERRPFRPHLTLGRRVLLPQGLDLRALGQELPGIEEQVKRVSLMRSERIGQKLIYTELYHKNLEGTRP